MLYLGKVILAVGLLLVCTTPAQSAKKCFVCEDEDGSCKDPKSETCQVTAPTAPAAGNTTASTAGGRDYQEDLNPDPEGNYPGQPPNEPPEQAPGGGPAVGGGGDNSSVAPDAGAKSSEPAPGAAASSPNAFIQFADDTTTTPAAAGSPAAPGATADFFCATLTGKKSDKKVTYKGCVQKENDCGTLKFFASVTSPSCKTCKEDDCNKGDGFAVKPVTLLFLLVIVMILISTYY